MQLADAVWERCSPKALDRRAIPPHVWQVAKHCVTDWMGCAIAGSAQDLSQMLRGQLLPQLGDGPATIIGTRGGADTRTAALVNGTAGHALDFDDTNIAGRLHLTAPILPAPLALAEADRRSGEELLIAFVAGAEAACRFGAAIDRSHYDRGWHSTSVVGVLGAAAATGWLHGLTAEQWGAAVGIAASQSCGLQANFGTMTKPLHAGKAAEGGLLAGTLAAIGYSGEPTAFEGRRGLAAASSTGPVAYDPEAGFDDAWGTPRTLFKYHASCHGSHANIEAVASLREHLTADNVESATVWVHPTITAVCRIDHPETGLAAKFSLPVTFAITVLGYDTASPQTFADALVHDEAVMALAAKVTVREDDQLSATGARVVVTTTNGTFEATSEIGTPATDLGAQTQSLRTKFLALAEPVIGSAAIELVDRLETLDAVGDVSTFMRMVRDAAPAPA